MLHSRISIEEIENSENDSLELFLDKELRIMETKRITTLPLLFIFSVTITSCALVKKYSHVNEPSTECGKTNNKSNVPSGAYLATAKDIKYGMDWKCRNRWKPDKGFQNPAEGCTSNTEAKNPNFIGVSLSGGGSRAAVFSAAVLFELEAYGILQQATVISSASGGSITAALYGLSCNDLEDDCPPTITGTARYKWKPEVIFPLIERNFIIRWVGNWFYPPNILRFWFTYFDRGDAMAGTFSNSLYGNTRIVDESLRFRDLNPRRPYLCINATNNTDSNNGIALFSFTKEDFEKIDSCLDLYPVSYAVTASASFPAVFHYVTLQDYSRSNETTKHFIHLMDAGVADNLAVEGLKEFFEQICELPRQDETPHILLIIAVAHIPSNQISAADPDPRTLLDRIIDTNFIDTYDVMMSELEKLRVHDIRRLIEDNCGGKLIQLQFSSLKRSKDTEHLRIYEIVHRIKTSLKIDANDANCLRHAARILVRDAVNDLRNGDPYWNSIVGQSPSVETPLPPCMSSKTSPD